jgi:transporter family protein
LTLVLWGFWGFFGKLAAVHIDWKQSATFFAIGLVIPAFVLYLYDRPAVNIMNVGSWYAIVSGIVALLGLVAMYAAFQKAEASLVVTITALYPLFTILLSTCLLKERITMSEGLGMFLAVVGIVLMTR